MTVYLKCVGEGNGIITIYNNSLCTPDVSVVRDNVVSTCASFTETVQADAGDVDIEFNLLFISLCTALDTTVDAYVVTPSMWSSTCDPRPAKQRKSPALAGLFFWPNHLEGCFRPHGLVTEPM